MLNQNDTTPHSAAPALVEWEASTAPKRFCQTSPSEAKGTELNKREALEVCAQLIELGTPRVHLCGGETLSRPDWQAIVGSLTGAGIEVDLLSDGWSIDANTARSLKKAGEQRLNIWLNMDGPESIHDTIWEHNGAFKKAVEAFHSLRNAELPIGIVTRVAAGACVDSLDQFGNQIINELQPDCWRIQIAVPTLQANTSCYCANTGIAGTTDTPQLERKTDWLSQLEYARVVTYVSRARRLSAQTRTIVYPGDCLGYMSSIEESLRPIPWQGCQAGLHVLGIRSDGGVKSCLSIPGDEYVEGNVLDEGLERIWSRPGAFKFTRQFVADQLSGACNKCVAGPICRGGCNAKAVAASGKPGEAPYCLRAIEDNAIAEPQSEDATT